MSGIQLSQRVLTVADTIKKYTPELTDFDIKAFVWYNRTLGIPMNGWENWFIGKVVKPETVTAVKNIDLYNNKWEVIGTATQGDLLGKPTRFEHTYLDVRYIAIRQLSGSIVLVDKSSISELGEKVEVSESDIFELCKNGSLYYLNGDFVPLHVYTNTDAKILKDSFEKEKQYILENFGISAISAHEKVLERYSRLMVDHPDPSKRYIINPFNEIYSSIILETEGEDFFDKTLMDSFERFVYNLTDSQLEKMTANEFRRVYRSGAIRSSSQMSEDEKQAVKETNSNAQGEMDRICSLFVNEYLNRQDRAKINLIVNENYNQALEIDTSKVPVGFPCSSHFGTFEFSLRPVQVEAFKYAVSRNSFCLALTVGFGKTSSLIAILSYMISSGVSKKPLLVVPKAVYLNWKKEAFGYYKVGKNGVSFTEPKSKKENVVKQYGILEGTGIEPFDLYNLNLDVIRSGKLSKEGAIHFVTYEGFKKIAVSNRDSVSSILSRMYNIFNNANVSSIDELETIGELKKAKSLFSKYIKNSVEAKCFFDVENFDYFFADEAHRFKNLFSKVPEDPNTRIKSNYSASQSSDNAFCAFAYSTYLQQKYGGGRTGFLTATPFSNSPLELIGMLTLINYKDLVRNNVQTISKFVTEYFDPAPTYAIDKDGEVKVEILMKRFKNKRSLFKILKNAILKRDGSDKAMLEVMGIRRPCIVRYPNTEFKLILKPSLLQEYQRAVLTGDFNYINKIKQEISEIYGEEDMSSYAIQKYIDDIDSAYNYVSLKAKIAGSLLVSSRASALSPFAQSPIKSNFISSDSESNWKELYEHSPKIKFTCDTIRETIKYHNGRSEKESGFVIFVANGRNIFDSFKRALEEVCGFERNLSIDDQDDSDSKKKKKSNYDEVMIIDSSVNDEQKDFIQNLFNKGLIKVIIGTATIREGVNLQENSATLFNLFPDWNSTDIEQLEGRIHRQKNRFGYVRIITPLVIGSMDSFIYQKYEEKSARLKDLWTDSDLEVSEDLSIDISPEVQKETILNDPEQILKIRLGYKRKDFYRKMSIIKERYNSFSSNIQNINSYRDLKVSIINNTPKYIDVIQDNLKMLEYILSVYEENPQNEFRGYLGTKDSIQTRIENYAILLESLKKADLSKLPEDYVNAVNRRAVQRAYTFDLGGRGEEFSVAMSIKGFKNYKNLMNSYGMAYTITGESADFMRRSDLAQFKSVYGDTRQFERTVLKNYNLTLESQQEDLEKLKQTIVADAESLKSEILSVFTEMNMDIVNMEYANKELESIKKYLDSQNELSMDIDMAVDRFASQTNLLLSYHIDNTDISLCKIPKKECCEDIVMPPPIDVEQIEEEEEVIVDSPKKEEVKTKVNVETKNKRIIPEYGRSKDIGSIFEKLYDALNKIADLDELKRKGEFYQRIGPIGETIEPLSVEYYFNGKLKNFRGLQGEEYGALSLTQFYIQEGDLMSDPFVKYLIVHSKKVAIPLEYQLDGMGVYKRYVSQDFTYIEDTKGAKDCARFTIDNWVPNLIEQKRFVSNYETEEDLKQLPVESSRSEYADALIAERKELLEILSELDPTEEVEDLIIILRELI